MSTILRPLISLVNYSKKVSNEQVKLMVIAIQNQLNNDVAPNWHKEPYFIIFYEDPKKASIRAYPIAIFDSPDMPESVGYHAEKNGKPYGRVFVETVLEHDGAILFDPSNPNKMSVSSVLSREIIEMFIDKGVNTWADGPKLGEGSSYAYEVCAPVQNNFYTHTIYGKTILVSNFVFPTWFENQAPKTVMLDFMKTTPGPFQVALGGYMIVRNEPGTEQIVFDDAVKSKQQETDKYIPQGRVGHRFVNKKVGRAWWKYLI